MAFWVHFKKYSPCARNPNNQIHTSPILTTSLTFFSWILASAQVPFIYRQRLYVIGLANRIWHPDLSSPPGAWNAIPASHTLPASPPAPLTPINPFSPQSGEQLWLLGRMTSPLQSCRKLPPVCYLLPLQANPSKISPLSEAVVTHTYWAPILHPHFFPLPLPARWCILPSACLVPASSFSSLSPLPSQSSLQILVPGNQRAYIWTRWKRPRQAAEG